MANNLLQQAVNPQNVTAAELERRIARYSGFVKTMTGAANNAAIPIVRECHDRLRAHPRYKQNVKKLFNTAVIDEYRRYRQNLINPPAHKTCFFDPEDMTESQRRVFDGKLTSQRYYEFWEGTGALTYQKSQPLIGSLHNKLRLSLLGKTKHPEILAWGLVGAEALNLAVEIWRRSVESVHKDVAGLVPKKTLLDLFSPFDLSRISVAWERALKALAPEIGDYDINAAGERNVALGVEQLEDLWVSADLPFDSIIKAVKDYEEDVFVSKGAANKMVSELTDMRNDTLECLDKEMVQQRKESTRRERH